MIYDAAVIGAGILGLAHAYHLARKGLRVVVLERNARAAGASLRNFGMIWPIGQPPGPLYQVARRSRDIWLDVLRESGLYRAECGSLHLAYHDDEEQVLREFLALGDRPCEWLASGAIEQHFPAVVQAGLRGGVFSPVEVTVDPREAIRALPGWLHRTLGVDFVFDARVIAYDRPRLSTVAGEWNANQVIVCTGADFRELAPEAFAASQLVACKLQMMRTQPLPFRLGTMLAAGLTLRHYKCFAACPTLPALARRLDAQLPEYARFGIHVMAAQNGLGEVVLGDSHEYGEEIEPFDKPEIDELVLAYLRTFATLPAARIAARWNGTYIKHPTAAYLISRPSPHLTAVNAVGGAGMTLSFGLAEQVVGGRDAD